MRKNIGFLVAAGALTLPGLAAAATPTLSDVLVSSGITATGSLQGSYVYGFNKGQTLAYHAFDTNGDTFALNQANLSLAYQPSEGFGGLVNVIAGDDAKVINTSYAGSASSSDFALAQGFVQYATGPLTVIAGRYYTLAGAEVVDGSLDANISRGLLNWLAEPLVHTGVRASYKVTDTVTAYLGVNNSAYAGLSTDVNKQKTIESGVAFAPTSALSLAVYDYYSRESDSLSVNYLDTVASYKVTDALTFTVNGDWFTYRGAGEATDGNIAGIATYVSYAVTPKLTATVRGEYLKTKNVVWYDGDGKSNVSEGTATLAYSPATNFTLMGEYRYDKASDKIFPNPSYPDYTTSPPDTSMSTGHQGAFELKAILKFGTPPAT